MLLLPVPFELCVCPEQYFFLVDGRGRGGVHRLHLTSGPGL